MKEVQAVAAIQERDNHHQSQSHLGDGPFALTFRVPASPSNTVRLVLVTLILSFYASSTRIMLHCFLTPALRYRQLSPFPSASHRQGHGRLSLSYLEASLLRRRDAHLERTPSTHRCFGCSSGLGRPKILQPETHSTSLFSHSFPTKM